MPIPNLMDRHTSWFAIRRPVIGFLTARPPGTRRRLRLRCRRSTANRRVYILSAARHGIIPDGRKIGSRDFDAATFFLSPIHLQNSRANRPAYDWGKNVLGSEFRLQTPA